MISTHRVDKSLLKDMNVVLSHRGPDGEGIWIDQQDDFGIGLGHRRLSIIDLSLDGSQPMHDSTGTLSIVFNGEIYNYKEIKEILIKEGYVFYSKTDTEVILNAYRKWGFDSVRLFNGMFAFVLYDSVKGIIFGARDRVGKKPLYYARYKDRTVLASEAKAILVDADFRREVDVNALNFFFAFGYVPGHLSIYKGIKKVRPASAFVVNVRNQIYREWTYWALQPSGRYIADEMELQDELESLLLDAVRLRLRSDVPLGAFLSGGLDSSLVVSLMSKASSKQIKTFSVGFEESPYSELKYAKVVADYFGTDHHEIMAKMDSMNILPRLVTQFDEPIADSSIIPTYHVCNETRRHVTVALTGDGGDELFGGYTTYSHIVFENFLLSYLPLPVRWLIVYTAGHLPNRSIFRSLRRVGSQTILQNIGDLGILIVDAEERKSLFTQEATHSLDSLNDPEMYRSEFVNHFCSDYKDRMFYADFKTSLCDDILVKVDRSSMLVSLEARCPLLDYRIVELAFSKIPSSLKLRGLKTRKYILRQLAARHLPGGLDICRKQGFSIPLASWMKWMMRRYGLELLETSSNPYIERRIVKALAKQHDRGLSNHGKKLFAWLMFELWWRNFIEGVQVDF